MALMNLKHTTFLTSTFVLFLLISCTKDKVTTIDIELLDKAKDTTGFVWFDYEDTLLPHSSGSGHSEPFLRTRYNAIAATKLNLDGKIVSDALFPEGSLIVKELYNNTTTIGRYAILYKDSDNEFADAKGWVWGYVNTDGTVASSATKKGASCINCHSQSENIDYMLMNKYFP